MYSCLLPLRPCLVGEKTRVHLLGLVELVGGKQEGWVKNEELNYGN